MKSAVKELIREACPPMIWKAVANLKRRTAALLAEHGERGGAELTRRFFLLMFAHLAVSHPERTQR